MALTIEYMTIKERLHKLVDELTEAEAERAFTLVEGEHEDPVIAAFHDAPEDDEPWSDQDETAMAEVEADRATGVPTIPLEEIERELGMR